MEMYSFMKDAARLDNIEFREKSMCPIFRDTTSLTRSPEE
ncbi:hypothetical protein TREAZ_2421 [Leadbettera azotonutricia ZAS-9]|uniref:Uncharacterized protein n=1 Tax=Leadbettera azotonutricia (strain ATCC BAA-888 / DSM 13862 / ZAS-9) TaxID=545695 RepID=F5YFU6_LEAAZ|nr:hypothetical protein TREAZ_2421 [Leadbettera azotonutricia ZAS-9]